MLGVRDTFCSAPPTPFLLSARLTEEGIHHWFRNLKARATKDQWEFIADLTFHDLRHDFAHRAREAGWSLEEVAHYLGHVTKKGTPAIQTTVRYIWSESDNFELVAKSAYNAISLIRGVIGKSLVTCWDAAYEIADQTLIWTDLDACAVLLTEAENRRKESLQAVPFLEQALSLLERGELLEGEDGRWCYAFRRRAEDLFRQARIWLAEEYEAAGKLWQAGDSIGLSSLRTHQTRRHYNAG